MEISPSTLPWQSLYKLMIGSIVPRAIGWVSTVDEAGEPNLAPFSFFTAAGANPPHVLFCPMIRSTDGQPKDTLHNVRTTGEFVVNIVTEALGPQMNLTSTEFPAEVNEFAAAGLTPVPSSVVRPPRVGESPDPLRVPADADRRSRPRDRRGQRGHRTGGACPRR